MKTFASTILLSLLLVSVSWSAERIRIGYSSISGSYIGIWVAHDAGLFAKEGLEDEIILIPSGSQLAQVTVAGEVDVGFFNGSSAMAGAMQGADIKIIGNTVNKMIFSLYTKQSIKTADDLKGKKIGVTRFASSTDISLRYALRKHNVSEKEVTILQMGSISSIMSGLQSGSIDGGVVSPPTLFAVEKLGFKELINITDLDLAFPNPSVVAQGGILRSRAQFIDRFMRAYVRGMHRARTDKDLTIKSIARYSKIQDQFFLHKTYDLYVGKVLERAPYINMVGMKNALDDLAKTVPAAKDAKSEQFIDMGYLDRLEKSGLLKELYR